MANIVVFSGSHCAACDRVKAFLSNAGHTFTVRSIDEDDRAYDELLALGCRSIPVTVVGDTVITGFNPTALTQALAKQG